jgi:hypothetical protein
MSDPSHAKARVPDEREAIALLKRAEAELETREAMEAYRDPRRRQRHHLLWIPYVTLAAYLLWSRDDIGDAAWLAVFLLAIFGAMAMSVLGRVSRLAAALGRLELARQRLAQTRP